MAGICKSKNRFWASVFIAAVTLTLVFPGYTNATAGIVQPPHLSRFQSAIPPQGFRTICKRYAWACSNREDGRITTDKDVPAVRATTQFPGQWDIPAGADEVQFGFAGTESKAILSFPRSVPRVGLRFVNSDR
jgi:hypothetical protein